MVHVLFLCHWHSTEFDILHWHSYRKKIISETATLHPIYKLWPDKYITVPLSSIYFHFPVYFCQLRSLTGPPEDHFVHCWQESLVIRPWPKKECQGHFDWQIYIFHNGFKCIIVHLMFMSHLCVISLCLIVTFFCAACLHLTCLFNLVWSLFYRFLFCGLPVCGSYLVYLALPFVGWSLCKVMHYLLKVEAWGTGLC